MTPTEQTIIAVIPARGGSKGIPRKNLVPLAGKPLLAHTIDAARGSQYLQQVFVSTDDEEIAAVAREHGAEVIKRPAELSGDEAPSEGALLHALQSYEEQTGRLPEILVFLQCTSPLTLPEDIDGAISTLLEEEADSAFTATPFHYFLWAYDQEGNAQGLNHDQKSRQLRQQRQPQYLETGAVYVVRTRGFLQHRHRFFGKTVIHIVSRDRAIEIDDPVDRDIAETLLRLRRLEQKRQRLPANIDAVVFDFDGVFTDNTVLVLEDGTEGVLANRSDGHGLSQLRNLGVPLLVLSSEKNQVVESRCDKLGIPCLHGLEDKAATLESFCRQEGLDLQQVVFVGNDVNDLECMRICGYAVAVADAHPQVLQAADLVLEANGGKGAVRELCDLIIANLQARKGRTS